jgi:D-alanine-D-alanine ligase
MIKQNILVITGGSSSERRISFMSAKEVSKSLRSQGYKVKLFDLKEGLSKLTTIVEGFDVIFPVIHGEEGEGGELQKFLQKLDKPFIGGDWRSFKKGWYKIPFKRWCDQNNVLTPKWRSFPMLPTWSTPDVANHRKEILKFGIPCVLKTSNGGSSREVAVLKSKTDLNSYKVRRILSLNTPTLVEEYLPGIEITVGILGDTALSVVEIRPPEGEWFDYHNKYWGKTQELIDAPSLTEKQRKEIRDLTVRIHRELNLGHYSRIDFMFHEGKFYAIDVNTIPGLTPGSLLPKCAQGAGLTYNQLIQRLVDLSL